jgi:hypothetical protein
MTLFVRATLATLLLAMGWSPASIAQTSANACIDSDGDGYGWNGFETCDPAAGSATGNQGLPSGDTNALACIDSDGDGFGWNGFETCDPNAAGGNAPQNDAPTAQACIDSDGDGFGWYGSATCIPDGAGNNAGNTPQNDAPTAQACVDSDGDGFGWNGVATCIPNGSGNTAAGNDTGTNGDAGNDTGNNTGNTGSNTGNGTTYTSTFFPIGNVAADQCLTRQDALSGNYPGSITAGDFILSINAWNFGAAGGYNWEQCIFANSALGWTYDWGAGGGPGDFNVRSYPELIFGVKSGGEISGDSSREGTGLPVRVDNLPDITIDYSFTSNQTGPARTAQASVTPRFPNGSTIFGERNIAVESFFHPSDANGNCPASVVQRGSGQSNHTYEMMVWLDSGAERLPAGPSGYVTTINLDGGTYDVYTKNNDLKYVAFVRTNPSLTGTINWTSFIEWTRNNAHRVTQLYGAQTNSVQLQGDWCLANILVGNEIWWGAGDFTINQWQINRSY